MVIKCSAIVAMITVALWQPAQASVITSATFDSGASGWSALSVFADLNDDHPVFNNVLQLYPVTWSATGGNPGGTINEADQDSGWQYFTASSSFLGNQSAALGGMLTFDLLRTDAHTDFAAQAGPPLAITNGATTLVFSSASLPTTSGWTSYAFNLTPGAGIFVASKTGPQATPAQLSSVLSNVTGLYILSDWYTGIGDSYNLDNVVLSAPVSTPEPSSSALVLLGVVLFLMRRHH